MVFVGQKFLFCTLLVYKFDFKIAIAGKGVVVQPTQVFTNIYDILKYHFSCRLSSHIMYIVQGCPREIDDFEKIIAPFVLITENFYCTETKVTLQVPLILYKYKMYSIFIFKFYITQMVAILTNTHFQSFLNNFILLCPVFLCQDSYCSLKFVLTTWRSFLRNCLSFTNLTNKSHKVKPS